MSWIRLRQIALVARDLDATVAELCDVFEIAVAYNDPGVATFGLRNAVLPVGNQFIEVVSPTRDGTAGGRQLERLGGDGGYMVICHTDDQPAVRSRVDELGVRVVLDHDDHGYRIMQLHPADTGGSFLEIDHQPGGDDPGGPWTPAGPDWQRARQTGRVDGIVGVTVQCRTPAATASRWHAITGCDATDDVLRFDNATVHFVEGAIDVLIEASLTASDRSLVGAHHTIGGVRFTLV